jgi:hypothetical protein
MDNAGTISVGTGLSLDLYPGAILNNLPKGTINLPSGSGVGGQRTTINNGGTVRVAAGTGAARTFSFFNDPGTVEVQTGTFSLFGGSDISGTAIVAAGATLDFTNFQGSSVGTVYTLESSSAIKGDGSVTCGATYQFGPTATLNVAGIYALSGLTLNANGTVNVIRDVTLDRLTLNAGGILGGPGAVTVTGSLSWTGGVMSDPGQTIVLGTLDISGSGAKVLNPNRTLVTAGTSTWSGTGDLTAAGGALWDNREGAVLTIARDGNLNDNFTGVARFINAGTLRKVSTLGRLLVAIPFSNTGTVEVRSGMLAFGNTFTSYDPATHTLAVGTYVLAGALQFLNASVATNAATVVLDGPAGGVTDIQNHDALAGLALNAAEGRFILQGGRSLALSGGLVNAGVLTVGAGSTLDLGAAGFTQADGQTVLDGGTLAAGAGVFIRAGSLSGTGLIVGDLTNAGVVTPGGGGAAGLLGVTGNYTQTASGTLVIGLGGADAGTYAQLVVNGTATLDGTLQVVLLGDYVPAVGDRFTVLTFGGRNGDFASYDLPDLGAGRYLDPAYDAAGLTLVTRSA